LNIQTEHIENHSTRLVVEVGPEQLVSAKKKAAVNLSKRLNIPGFRKGKAPYNVVMRYVGESSILQDAVEIVADEIYPQALKDADVQPYGQGSLENIEFEPTLKLTFIVARQPSVTLSDYRAVRVEYALPEVTDETVDRAMLALQEQHAVVEPSSEPAVMGDRITADIHAPFAKAEPTATDSAEAAPEAADSAEAAASGSAAPAAAQHDGDQGDHDHAHDDHDHDHDHDEFGEDDPLAHTDPRDVFDHQHGAQITLGSGTEPLPGFSEAMVGATVGETRQFTLDVPADTEKYAENAGRRVDFSVTVSAIERVTLPALTDEFAARVTAEEERPLTLLELRIEMRKDLVEAARQRYDSDYQVRVLDAIRAEAQLGYPEGMIEDETQALIEQLERNLKQQKVSLDIYKTVYRKTDEDLKSDYRPTAIRNIERSLVMREVMTAEKIRLTTQDLVSEIDRMTEQFPEEQKAQVRSLFNNRDTLDSLANDLIRRKVLERMAAIARGENPAIEDDVSEADVVNAEPAAIEAVNTHDAGAPDDAQNSPAAAQ
jgi:trigger factor